MPSVCTFTLKKENEVYFAGKDKIEGYVTLKTNMIKHVKQIKVRFKGVSRCGFIQMIQIVEDEPSFPIPDIYYTSKDLLIKTEETVHEKGILPPGTYTWPFSFCLDEGLPTSMEGRSGHIRYQLSLKVYNQSKYKNLFLKPVTVIKTDDLNLRLECILPLQTVSTSSTTRCCGLIKTGGAHINMRTNFGGYASGQWIRYAVDVFNKTEGKEYMYEIRFIRKTKYKADKPTNLIALEETIIYLEEKVDNYQIDQTLENAFYLPPTPPTTKTAYISIKYILRVTLNVKCCPRFLRGELEVPIGTVPVKESLLPRQQRLYVEIRDSQYIISVPLYEKPEGCDATFIDLTTDKRNRDDTFMPNYPSYRYIDR